MNILRVRCRSAEEFRSFYNTDHPDGGIFCPTTKQLEPEAEVVVEIVCKVLPNRVFVRGTVVSWRPALPRLRVRAGALVRFAPEEATKTQKQPTEPFDRVASAAEQPETLPADGESSPKVEELLAPELGSAAS